MTSLDQFGVKIFWLLFPGGIVCGGDFPRESLGLGLEALVPTQLLVTKTSSSNQCNKAEQKATEKPSRPVMAFVGSYVTGIKRAGEPNEKQHNQKAHYQSVTAL